MPRTVLFTNFLGSLQHFWGETGGGGGGIEPSFYILLNSYMTVI